MAKQSDRELQKKITYLEKQIAKLLPRHQWTREKLQADLDYYRSLLAMPKSQRPEYRTGTL